ncbi:MAG TPA: hypothetical protein VN905_01880 [Candidatus Binatia bacterium]|nr:hypothetical protein [Candidatus Binatia bacterium]
MSDLEAIREEIPSYAGYEDATIRPLADKQLRAWLGERLTLLDARLGLADGPLAKSYEHLLRECEFSDPHAVRALEEGDFDAGDLALLYTLDHRLIEGADRAESIDASNVAGYLQELEHLFASRNALILEQAKR